MSRLTFWLLVGFLGQALFTARFVVQWLVSERKHDSVVPVEFWWLSLLGGGALLSYAISRQDPVIFVGQAMGLLVYVRNLMLVAQAKRHTARVRQRQFHGARRRPRPGIVARLRKGIAHLELSCFLRPSRSQAQEPLNSQPDIWGAHQ
jgi:lipid-A-disaccharide synthase-like uncharacterized protein